MAILYKPLLRKFRQYLRTEFDQGRKHSLYQHWSSECYLENVRSFMKKIRVPNNLCRHDYQLIMLTILFPCTVKYVLPNTNPEERHLMVTVFRENSNRTRLLFFSNPLVKYLWNQVFMRQNPEIIMTQLRLLKSDKYRGQRGVNKFVESMREIE